MQIHIYLNECISDWKIVFCHLQYKLRVRGLLFSEMENLSQIRVIRCWLSKPVFVTQQDLLMGHTEVIVKLLCTMFAESSNFLHTPSVPSSILGLWFTIFLVEFLPLAQASTVSLSPMLQSTHTCCHLSQFSTNSSQCIHLLPTHSLTHCVFEELKY